MGPRCINKAYALLPFKKPLPSWMHLVRYVSLVILTWWSLIFSCASTVDNEGPDPMTLYPVQSPDWYRTDHHDGSGGFRNVWGNDRDAPFFRSFSWLISRAVTSREHTPPPALRIQPESLQVSGGGLQVHWIGHSTTHISAGESRVLIDPIFSRRASPVSFAGPEREVPLPIALEDLPGVDVVLISHDHYDHLDKESIRDMEREFSPLFLVPLDLGDIVRGWGASRVLELDWWQYVDVEGVRYTCTPAQHFSGRGLHNRNGTLWAGWHMAFGDGTSLFYAGDSGYAAHFQEIRSRLGAPNVALIPIGAYLPRWFMGVVHVDPAEALRAFEDLEADHMIGVHWGTFDLAEESLQEPGERVRQLAHERGLSDRIHVLDIGAAFTYEAHTTPTEDVKSRL